MIGRWREWERRNAWELDLGVLLRGTVVHYSMPPFENTWMAAVNSSCLGHFKDFEEAKRVVEKTIRRDMQGALEDWTFFLNDRRDASSDDELDRAVNAAIVACDGDMRSTIRSLLVANGFLEEEHDRLLASISNGFARGKHRTRQQ